MPNHGRRAMTEVERKAVLDLLATIHGDGGHYVARHGIEEAALEAIQLWYRLLEGNSFELMAREDRADSAEKALEDACKLALRTLGRVTFGGIHDWENERDTFLRTLSALRVRRSNR
jgi:hypothetical protein